MKTKEQGQPATESRPTLKSPQRRFALCCAVLLALLGCVSKPPQTESPNWWGKASVPAFQAGLSTQGDILRALGPPSQVITKRNEILFYYQPEPERSRALWLAAPHRTRRLVFWDSALFFFDRRQVLTSLLVNQGSAARLAQAPESPADLQARPWGSQASDTMGRPPRLSWRISWRTARPAIPPTGTTQDLLNPAPGT